MARKRMAQEGASAAAGEAGVAQEADSAGGPSGMADVPDATRQARYNLVLPEASLRELQGIASKRGITLVDLLRKFIRLGLLYNSIEDKPDSALIIRDGGKDREIILY
ncbi:MAG: hypothetical protein NTZ05_19440 [Chloroflexi bacterium]|nr:hypothetical protein [Chloroflexota bacterium]